MANKYVSPSKLSVFLENLKTIFSPLVHKHSLSEISDYKVDTELSNTSNNPIANSTIDAEFNAISDAMGALELAIDGKADASHTHTVSNISDLTATADELNLVSGVTDNIQTQLNTLVSRMFIGTYAEYENAKDSIPLNAIVIITDDETSSGGSSSDDSTSSTTAMLGYAVLGQMVLG